MMLLSRLRPSKSKPAASTVAEQKEKKKIPELAEYLEKRDYTGAISLLEFQRQAGKGDQETDLWLAYCAFHNGDYKRSNDEYEKLLSKKGCPQEVFIFLACCQFYLGLFDEGKATAEQAPKSPLKNRLLFHLSHKLGEEKSLMAHHQQLQDVLEDQLCLASIHYLRSHYQEAIDIYKRILLGNRNFIALNVYLALCYYKLDYYDVSLEVLQVYSQQYPDSATAVNLRACNHFKLYNGRAAETELKSLQEQSTPDFKFAREILKHNLEITYHYNTLDGEGESDTGWPHFFVYKILLYQPFCVHEKKIGLDSVQEAYKLLDVVNPNSPNEYILKGIVHCLLGQQQLSKEHLKIAEEYFRLVGGSAAECDTIPGRQCMASAYFLLRQFEETLVYLNSVKSYFYNDDTFNYNYGQALSAQGKYKEAEDVLLLIQNEKVKADFTYISTLARCYIMNSKAKLAWELYLKMETSAESFSLLQLIANDCYKMGQFYYAAKAFDVLERLDPNPEYWQGKRGSCVGVFQLVIAGREPGESLRDVIRLLQNTSHPQVDQITRVMKKWAKDNKISI